MYFALPHGAANALYGGERGLNLSGATRRLAGMRRVVQWGSWVTVASYTACLLLIAAGPSSPLLGVIGVVGWLAAMALALLNLVLGGLALAWDGRAARGIAAVSLGVFAAGVTVSVLLLSAIPNQS